MRPIPVYVDKKFLTRHRNVITHGVAHFLSSKPVVMKRLLLSLALALPMLQLLATNPPLIENVLMNTNVEDRSLVVRLANLQKEKTVLTLESLDGQEVYHEQVIKDHNGFLDVTSKSGCGATFTIYLPVSRRDVQGNH